MVIRRTAWWPAFMVQVETEWQWGPQRVVLSHTVPFFGAGVAQGLGRMVQFDCRGNYELIEVRISSAFPLGLIRAERKLARPNVRLHVLPQAQAVRWPLPWDVAEDPVGELTTRRIGQSFELGMLRPYRQGEAVGRISWRASARVGELVIQHFQQRGSIRLRVVVQVPNGQAFGDPQGAGEQAIRLAAGVCDAGLGGGAKLFVYLDPDAAPLHEGAGIRRALAQVPPSTTTFSRTLSRAAGETRQGEQVALVVPCTSTAGELENGLAQLAQRAASVLVCIAIGRQAPAAELAQARALQQAVAQTGVATFMEAP